MTVVHQPAEQIDKIAKPLRHIFRMELYAEDLFIHTFHRLCNTVRRRSGNGKTSGDVLHSLMMERVGHDLIRPHQLPEQIQRWMGSSHPYTIRFGLGMLMSFYLDEGFQMEDLDLAAGVRREEYYVKMMAAWYFATALAKQYDAALPYLRQRRLDRWTHNKTIQKAVESYRITPEQKDELRSLRWKDCAKEEGV